MIRMLEKIPAEYHDLLADETRAMAFLATIMSDGSPQVTPVWFNTDGTHILVNSAQGRVKDRNMRARPQVALAISAPGAFYRYLQIRGRVVEVTTQGAAEHISVLSQKYEGKDYDLPPGMVRVIYKIFPEQASGSS